MVLGVFRRRQWQTSASTRSTARYVSRCRRDAPMRGPPVPLLDVRTAAFRADALRSLGYRCGPLVVPRMSTCQARVSRHQASSSAWPASRASCAAVPRCALAASCRPRSVRQVEASRESQLAHDQQAGVLGDSLTSVEQRGHITEVRGPATGARPVPCLNVQWPGRSLHILAAAYPIALTAVDRP